MLKHQARRLLLLLAKPDIIFYSLPWLIFILFYGTLAQRSIGLYEAEKQFFTSFIIWLGPLPLPGIYSLMGLIGLALMAKLILKSPWRKANAGTLITHLGALLLFIGGMLTAITSEEGFIVLGQGEQSHLVSDYHARMLTITKNDTTLLSLPAAELKKGQKLAANTPFEMTLREVCRHCKPDMQNDTSANYRGLAEKISISPAALQANDADNHFGVMLDISGAGEEQDGTYLAFEIAPHQPGFTLGEDSYHFKAEKEKRILPFEVRLESFKKITYPGSDIAEEFESVVTILDGTLEWQAIIRMNEPLRYKGYTLYQSSFITKRAETFSVLAVVKNTGRVFPYISSIVMCLGLLIHLLLRRRKTV